MKIYTAKIEEIIMKDNEPTFELRIRIPQIHGEGRNSLIKTKDLPKARPLVMPGLYINKEKFLEKIEKYKTVKVYLDNKLERATYIGFIGEEGDFIGQNEIMTNFNKLDGGTF